MKVFNHKYTISKYELKNAVADVEAIRDKDAIAQLIKDIAKDKCISKTYSDDEIYRTITHKIMVYEPNDITNLVKRVWELGAAYGDAEFLPEAKKEQELFLFELSEGKINLKNCFTSKTCPKCKGEGQIQQTDIDYDPCRMCKGTGLI